MTNDQGPIPHWNRNQPLDIGHWSLALGHSRPGSWGSLLANGPRGLPTRLGSVRPKVDRPWRAGVGVLCHLGQALHVERDAEAGPGGGPEFAPAQFEPFMH